MQKDLFQSKPSIQNLQTVNEGTPKDDELEELGNEIGKDWIKLGRRLEVSDQNIREINEAHDQLSEKGYHVLKQWKQQKGSAATYQALCEALQHKLVQRKDLAEKFCYINAPADPVSEGTVTGELSGAAASARDGGHSTGVISARKRKSDERGVLSWKMHCVSATSKKSGKQDPQEQTEIVDKYMEQKINEANTEGRFDRTSINGLRDFHAYLCGHLLLVDPRIQKSSIKITVKCRTLEILERLWDNYCAGRLNAEAEKCLITENIKEELGMETIKLATTILEEDYLACKYSLMETAGNMATCRSVQNMAIPLCLPNNYHWSAATGECIETGERRSSFYVVKEALQKLRTVRGPVCVVSVAGPYRKGKSWVLSQAFNQPEVFPLGHELVAETMGIWLWIVPEKYRDSKGQEFTVVLLDSEGIDAATGEGLDDNQIFTLTVLLASVLIYNSQGVPTRRDLEELDFIVKLTHRIEMRSTTTRETRKGHHDSEYFHKTFPYFIWLLRDVTQAVPSDCSNIKEYFLKKVFKVQDSSVVAQEGQKVAESILSFFPGFEAFTLPCPTVNPEMMKSINDNKDDINPLFFTGLEEFKRLLWNILVPKNSFNDEEVVTGEGLAALVEQYVLAINTPGVIPNVQNAWNSFVEAKCSNTLKDALEAYEVAMKTQLKDKLPCNNDQLRRSHDVALQNSENHFNADTAGISINTIEKYLKKLKELLGERFNLWQIKNATSTREFCNDLLIQLKQAHLDPVLQQLRGEGGAKLSFDDIIGGYKRIKDEYDKSAIGAKDVIAAVFFEFHPELMEEQEQYLLGLLRQLKDYDEKLTQELAAKAYQEQEKQKLEEQQEQLRHENRAVKREMEILSEKQREERQKFREQMDSELRVQREQLNNMMEANMEQAQQERERLMQENQELKNQFLAVQKANEENMKMIKKLSDLVSKQEEEKRHLHEQMAMERAKQAESKRQELLQRMEVRHREEKEKLRREMEAKIEAQCNALTEEYRKAAEDRMEGMLDKQERIQEVEEQLEEVKKPGFIKRSSKKVKGFRGAAVDKVKENCSVM